MRKAPDRQPLLEDRRPRGERPPPSRDPFRWLRHARNAALAGVVLALIGWVVLFYALAPELPSLDTLRGRAQQRVVTVLADDGSVLARRGTSGARFVEYDAIAPTMVNAVVATEDRRFWQHFGIDLYGTARALVTDLRHGGVVEGGSTITQQLAKNLYLTPERSIRRKLQELMLAIWLETRLDKREIITLYLNQVYFGSGAYGVEAAAQRYFAHPAKDLTLPEAAVLAGLLKAPSKLAPTNDIDLARDRAAIVLGAMVEAGYISQRQAAAAEAKPAKLAPDSGGELAGWFVDWSLDELAGLFGKTQGDLTVRTTVNPYLQKVAEKAVAASLDPAAAARGATEAAVVLLDRSGAIRAYVGGRSYRASGFDRAADAHRQPGSAFKPFVYLAGLEHGLTPETRITDRPLRIEKYEPRNFNGRYQGSMTLTQAFAQSVNTVAIQVGERVGRERVIEVARRCGITSPLQPWPSLALGPFEVTLLELTGAYEPFATGGLRRPPFGIAEVIDPSGRRLYRHQATEVRVADGHAVSELRQLMEATVAEGTGRAADPGDRLAGGKTGTTQNARDAWFVGFAGDYVAGVWVGNDQGQPMQGVTGSTLPARLWRTVIQATPKGAPLVAEARPEGRGQGGAQPIQEGFDWLLDTISQTFGKLVR